MQAGRHECACGKWNSTTAAVGTGLDVEVTLTTHCQMSVIRCLKREAPPPIQIDLRVNEMSALKTISDMILRDLEGLFLDVAHIFPSVWYRPLRKRKKGTQVFLFREKKPVGFYSRLSDREDQWFCWLAWHFREKRSQRACGAGWLTIKRQSTILWAHCMSVQSEMFGHVGPGQKSVVGSLVNEDRADRKMFVLVEIWKKGFFSSLSSSVCVL